MRHRQKHNLSTTAFYAPLKISKTTSLNNFIWLKIKADEHDQFYLQERCRKHSI